MEEKESTNGKQSGTQDKSETGKTETDEQKGQAWRARPDGCRMEDGTPPEAQIVGLK